MALQDPTDIVIGNCSPPAQDIKGLNSLQALYQKSDLREASGDWRCCQ